MAHGVVASMKDMVCNDIAGLHRDAFAPPRDQYVFAYFHQINAPTADLTSTHGGSSA
jgi:hypothetical protein